jgi:hypothetical protein
MPKKITAKQVKTALKDVMKKSKAKLPTIKVV